MRINVPGITEPVPTPEFANPNWVKSLCRQYYLAGVTFGFEQGVAVATDKPKKEPLIVIPKPRLEA